MKTLTMLALLALLGCQKGAPASEGAATPPEAVPEAAAEAETKPVTAEPTVTTTLLAQGADVPAITAIAHDGSQVDFKSYAGKPFVVYFYPKDDTPG